MKLARTGLFHLDGLSHPSDFVRIANKAVQRTDELVLHVCRQGVRPASLEVVDEVSDVLCRVMDAAELCRNVHVDPAYVAAADEVYMVMSRQVQRLNVHEGLHRVLSTLLDQHPLGGAHRLNAEQRIMSERMVADFRRSGITLPLEQRDEFSRVYDQTVQDGIAFSHRINTALGESTIRLPDRAKLHALPTSAQRALRHCTDGSSSVDVPLTPLVTQAVLKWVPDGEVRRRVFVAANSATKDNVATLESMLNGRHKLAQMLGFESYAHFFTHDKMAGATCCGTLSRVATHSPELPRPGTPAAARDFLQQLSASTRTQASRGCECERTVTQCAHRAPTNTKPTGRAGVFVARMTSAWRILRAAPTCVSAGIRSHAPQVAAELELLSKAKRRCAEPFARTVSTLLRGTRPSTVSAS
jgi:Zn-dependent oligopeptidase